MTRKDRFLRALEIAASFFLFPLLHYGVALAFTIREQLSAGEALLLMLSDELALAALPLAIIKGRYPTIAEMTQLNIPNYVVMGLSLLLFWILAALLLRWGLRQLHQHLLVHRWGRVGVGIMLVCVMAWVVAPVLPFSRSMQIQVDVSQALGLMPSHHRGFSQGGEGQMKEPGYFEAAMSRLSVLEPALVRIDHLYDYYNVYTQDTNGQAVYDWTHLDRQVEAIISAGAAPFMSVSYTPSVLSPQSPHTPPSDLESWEELVYQTVYHYNVELDLQIRYWEVWNEPNLSHFWAGSLEDYLMLYEVTARAIRRADPSALVGGPGLASSGANSLAYFNDRNWVMALVHGGVPLDFVSWHLYSTDPQQYRRSIDMVRSWVAGMDPQPKLLITEWNWNGRLEQAMDDGTTVAYIPAVIAEMSDAALDQALFFEPIDATVAWEGRWGMMRADASIKPAYNSFRLLSELSGERLPVQSDYPGLGALASRDGERVSVLIWNDRSGLADAPIELTLANITVNAQISASIYGVDSTHGNTYLDSGADQLFIETVTLTPVDSVEQVTIHVPEGGIRLLQFDLR